MLKICIPIVKNVQRDRFFQNVKRTLLKIKNAGLLLFPLEIPIKIDASMYERNFHNTILNIGR